MWMERYLSSNQMSFRKQKTKKKKRKKAMHHGSSLNHKYAYPRLDRNDPRLVVPVLPRDDDGVSCGLSSRKHSLKPTPNTLTGLDWARAQLSAIASESKSAIMSSSRAGAPKRETDDEAQKEAAKRARPNVPSYAPSTALHYSRGII